MITVSILLKTFRYLLFRSQKH